MADASPVAPPVAPAASPSSNPNPPASPAKSGSAAAPAPKGAADKGGTESWSDTDREQLFGLLKKSPFRFKANGEEKALDNEESLRAVLNDASRGRGALKVVEEAKKEAAEAKRLREEAERDRTLVERARRGDFEARLALGLVAPDEKAELEAELAKMPPEVRQLLSENEAMKQELAASRAAAEQQKAEAEKARTTALKQQALKTATGYVQKVFEASGLDLKAEAEEARPWMAAVLQAMREFDAHGLDIAQGTTVEQLVSRARELREEASERSFGRLKAEKRLALVRGDLEALADRFGAQQPTATAQDLVSAVGKKAAFAISRAVAQVVRAQKSQPAQPSTPEPKQPEEKREERRPLAFGGCPFFGFGR